MMEIISSKNLSAFSNICLATKEKFSKVNQPLPWIEPSINMIHLDVIRSFVFGSSLASIGCAAYLLEHSLRMALWDPIESGSRRINPTDEIFNETMGILLNNNEYSNKLKIVIPDNSDLLWWKSVTKAVRNKVNHVDIPAIFRIARELQLESDYAYSWTYNSNSWNIENPDTWGMFWHRYGEKLAGDFIIQVTDQVNKLISNTKWRSDDSWWISQKNEYEGFFKEKWDFESLQETLNKVYTAPT